MIWVGVYVQEGYAARLCLSGGGNERNSLRVSEGPLGITGPLQLLFPAGSVSMSLIITCIAYIEGLTVAKFEQALAVEVS